jgi:hypothetical protein
VSGLVSESFNPNEYRMAIQASYQSEVGNGNQFTSFQSVVEKIASIAKAFVNNAVRENSGNIIWSGLQSQA